MTCSITQILLRNVNKFHFVPLLTLLVCLFLRNRGSGCRQKKYQRSSEHHARLAELDTVHNQAFTDSPPPSTPPPPLALAGNPSPSPPPPPRAVRRLNMLICSQQTADPAAQPQSLSQEPECAASPDEEAEWAPSYLDQLSPHYPTPPPAPHKDQYVPPSDRDSQSEAETSDSECPPRRLPAKVLHNGQLKYHKAYDGPRPITYVDTRLYQGGPDDYIEAFNDDEVIWLRVIRNLLDAHHIPRQKI